MDELENRRDPGPCRRCEKDVQYRWPWLHPLGMSLLCLECYAGEVRLQGEHGGRLRVSTPDFA